MRGACPEVGCDAITNARRLRAARSRSVLRISLLGLRACRSELSPSVCVTKCCSDTLATYVERTYSHALPENSHLSKPLKQRDFLEAGTHLAAIRDKSFVWHKHGLEISIKSILDHSFRYTKSIDMDLRRTLARIRREQRQETLAQ